MEETDKVTLYMVYFSRATTQSGFKDAAITSQTPGGCVFGTYTGRLSCRLCLTLAILSARKVGLEPAVFTTL